MSKTTIKIFQGKDLESIVQYAQKYSDENNLRIVSFSNNVNKDVHSLIVLYDTKYVFDV